MRMKTNEGEGKSFSWCPLCKHWVPSKYFIAEYDRTDDVLTRMCFNCAHELGDNTLPTFKHKDCRYDPLFNLIKCPLCGKKDERTFEYNSKARKGDPQRNLWHCGNPECNKDFIYYR